MNDTRISITLHNREIILVGTAHVSKESIDEVSRIIREDKPDIVCVELDAGRLKAISEKDQWQQLDLSKVFKEGKGFLLIANLLLSSFQKRMGTDIGVKPGSEMKIAIDVSNELNIPYSLCDREIQVTLRRAWLRCSLWSRAKLLSALLLSAFSSEKLSEAEIENLKNRNELEGMMNELANYLPEVKETLIDERDRYLASKIWSSKSSGKSVAVVGAGHLLGIKTHIEKIANGEMKEDVSDLESIPASQFSLKILTWVVPAIILGLVVLGFFQAGWEKSFEMIKNWALIRGSLAALGALIALAHPLTILVAFLGAPITAMVPFISIGVLTGITQITISKPRVKDMENITTDVSSVKGVYKNRLTKALLVFFLSAFGSSIGGFIAIPILTRLLVG